MASISPIDLQKALKGVEYPTTGENLAQTAQENGADQQLVDLLNEHGEEEFEGPNEVSRAVFESA
ncbi:DUF2795 domain-containing protein [Streptomyces cavernae]|uniref:DUF2795 domain-containing protein n=1 Tax=Streptomyces cavernae TaxID=2259034 RepID=UPI000FEBFF73|nr:DUF2795 domain-containing protein [Streptomyces cavernae]